jgi:hypothetical protein
MMKPFLPILVLGLCATALAPEHAWAVDGLTLPKEPPIEVAIGLPEPPLEPEAKVKPVRLAVDNSRPAVETVRPAVETVRPASPAKLVPVRPEMAFVEYAPMDIGTYVKNDRVPKILRINISGYNIRSSSNVDKDYRGNIVRQSRSGEQFPVLDWQKLQTGVAIKISDNGEERWVFVHYNRLHDFQFCERETCFADLDRALKFLAQDGMPVTRETLINCGLPVLPEGYLASEEPATVVEEEAPAKEAVPADEAEDRALADSVVPAEDAAAVAGVVTPEEAPIPGHRPETPAPGLVAQVVEESGNNTPDEVPIPTPRPERPQDVARLEQAEEGSAPSAIAAMIPENPPLPSPRPNPDEVAPAPEKGARGNGVNHATLWKRYEQWSRRFNSLHSGKIRKKNAKYYKQRFLKELIAHFGKKEATAIVTALTLLGEAPVRVAKSNQVAEMAAIVRVIENRARNKFPGKAHDLRDIGIPDSKQDPKMRQILARSAKYGAFSAWNASDPNLLRMLKFSSHVNKGDTQKLKVAFETLRLMDEGRIRFGGGLEMKNVMLYHARYLLKRKPKWARSRRPLSKPMVYILEANGKVDTSVNLGKYWPSQHIFYPGVR